jgi:beta-lactamase class A
MCSTFKGYASARVLQMVENGELTLDHKVFVDPAEIVANSPRTQPRAGSDMTLDELCQAALQVSDNTAGNLLLKTIGGPSAITAFARSIGDPSSRLDRWETALNAAVPGDPRDTSTPEALGGGYRTLLTGDALARRSGSSSKTGCGQTRRRACAQGCRPGGPPPTRPAAAITAAPTTPGSPTVPQVSACCSR